MLAVAVWQGTPPPLATTLPGVSWALDELASAASAAAADGAKLLVLPELFLGGYRRLSDAVKVCALSLSASVELERVRAIARQHQLGLVLGFFEKGNDGRVYNSAMAVDVDGTIASVYRKTHLFGAAEQAAFALGDVLGKVFHICGGVACALLICYDVEFPEAVRTCAINGAKLVLVPTANMHPYSFANDPMIRVRAFESHVHIVYANWSEHLNEDGVHFNGMSVISTPQGEPLLKLAPTDSGLFHAVCHHRVVAHGAAAGAGGGGAVEQGQEDDYLRDRRPELYRPAVERRHAGKCSLM